MKKLIFIVILAFLLVGCNVIVKRGQTQVDLTGTEGLTLTIENYPKELYIGQGAQIPITLENKGTAKASNGIVAITPNDAIKFRTPPKITGINLEGRSALIPIGERDTKIFTISSIILTSGKEKIVPLQALACYQYTTEASPVVCINPKLAQGVQAVESGCNFNDAQITSTQGAPVAVTRVSTVYFLDKSEVEFRIYVKNVGGGELIDQAAYTKKCLSTDPLSKTEKNIINIEAYMGAKQLNCYLGTKQVDKFKATDKGFSVVCRATIDTREAAYTTPLSLYLDYGYVVSEVFSITLKNPTFSDG